ncbi:MAG: response regulator [Candidatus Woesearchaeota archaeon]
MADIGDYAGLSDPVKNILVVDDDEASRILFTEVFSAGGYTVYPFGNPFEALENYASVHPCALVVDYRLPGLSGLDFVDCLRSSYDVDIPVFGLSAEPDFAHRDDVKERFDHVFLKPTSYYHVLDTVNAYLSSTRELGR